MSPLRALFDEDFPDPSALYFEGAIYLYASRAYDGEGKNIQMRRSKSWSGPWENLGSALIKKPKWGKQATEFWSPDVPFKICNKFRLYYATNPDGGDGMAIAMAESSHPCDFVPAKDYIVAGDGYSAVDPFVLEFKNEHWLYWGSHHEPIRCRKLAPSGYHFAKDSVEHIVLKPSRRKYERLLEGFFLCYDASSRLWFAFVSGTDTWDPKNYAVTAYFASSPFGPFERIGLVVKPTSQWLAPGQNSVVTIKNKKYFVCHAAMSDDAMLPGVDKLKRVPCVAELVIEDRQLVLRAVT